jgi:hypothetical protein
MALSSPGVQVSVVDESFYTPAEPGTVPMIFVATRENKTNGSGSGTALGTTAANAGVPYLITSQRDLVETFGDPVFVTDNSNNAIHGSELNEYGLQAAYSLLGVSNRAYVVRADVDLGALVASSSAPTANPTDGTYWLDTGNTSWGIFEWNGNSITTTGGQSFSVKAPIVITDTTQVVNYGGGDYTPKTSVGAIGSYAVVAVTTLPKMWYKNTNGAWVVVGSAEWTKAWATVRGSTANPTISAGDDMVINDAFTITAVGGDDVNDIATYINGEAGLATLGITAGVVDAALEIYSTGVDVKLASSSGSSLLDAVGMDAGTYYAPKLQISKHTSVPAYKSTDSNARPTGSLWIKTTEPNSGARWRVKQFNGSTELFDDFAAPIFDNNQSALYGLDRSGGGANLAVGDLYVKSNVSEDNDPVLADFKIYRRRVAGATAITSGKVADTSALTPSAGAFSFTIQETDNGSDVLGSAITVAGTAAGVAGDADTIAGAVNSAGLSNVEASVDSDNKLTIRHTLGGDFRIADTTGILQEIGFAAFNVTNNSGTFNLYAAPSGDSVNDFIASNWIPLTYTASNSAPTSLAADGTLWYNSIVDEVDIMIHNGTTWVGYLDSTSPYYQASAGDQTDPAGPIVAASEPTKQSDGTDLKNGDVWVSTSDLESFPKIYKWNGALLQWDQLDTGDQTTEDGILFGDARWGSSGAASAQADIDDLLVNNYLDPDAPDPALYPKGMLLWNTRRSGFNVKKFVRSYIDVLGDNERFNNSESMSGYYPNRWVTESGNQEDGSGSFGRKAQRKVVIQQLQAMVNSNDAIRDDESRIFNLMATPGYPELIGEMITLNYDRGLSAFVVGDSPLRLPSDATSINEWGTNVNTVVEDNDDGLVSRDEYLGVFYPSGFSSDNAGNNVVVPASHMMLRTIALSDQVSYPWFAPAGTRRGGITNATATGYVDGEGEFQSVALNEGQRDTLQGVSVNPITFITGAGLVNFGQKTRARGASSLDRINVARLVIYLRSQLNRLAKPYIFEPNDKITRDQIKQAAESLLLELVGQRALYDYLVVCDESNNTPSRIDRNELYLDIAIEPVKSVEFIYIPLRLKNTGEIAGL